MCQARTGACESRFSSASTKASASKLRRNPRPVRQCRRSGSAARSWPRDGEDDAAFRGAVELGQHDAGDAERVVELLAPAGARSVPGPRRAPAAPRAARRHPTRSITRLIFFSSSIRCDCVCRRPAVSAISTSMRRALRRLQRVEDDRRGIGAGAPARSPARRCARPRLSAARRPRRGKCRPRRASLSSPCSLSRRASLPIVVVLPEPLTPTTRITNGAACGRSRAAVRRPQDVHQELCSAASSASRSSSSLRATLRRRSSRMRSGGFDADVGGDQPRLQLVENRVVDAPARQQVREVVGQPRIAAIELLAQALEQAGPGGLRRFFRLGFEPEHRSA